MANKTIAMIKLRLLLQHKMEGKSNRWISTYHNLARETVNQYVRKFEASGKSFSELKALTDEELSFYALSVDSPVALTDTRKEFNELLPVFIEALKRPKMTRMLVWEEYRQTHPNGYQYARFCELLSKHLATKNSVMILDHQPGEELFFDYAGDPLWYINEDGEKVNCPVFISVLPFSGLIYAEPTAIARRANLLSAMNNMIMSYGGVTASIKTDNMAQIVKKANRYEPVMSELALQWSHHYNTTLLATRVAKPRDKAAVESAVNTIYHRIYAALPKEPARSLEQLKENVRQCLDALNRRLLQGRDYSRMEKFEKYEKHLLRPLPSTPFVPKTTVEAVVKKNYHVVLGEDRHDYSVPHKFIGQVLKLIYDTEHVEVYSGFERVALHRRNYQRFGHTTDKNHMPSNHQAYMEKLGWTDEYFIELATKIGPNTTLAIKEILKNKIIREQTYNSCMGAIKLAQKFTPQRLEAACERALKGNRITASMLRNILEKNLDTVPQEELFMPLPSHDNIRGKENYQN